MKELLFITQCYFLFTLVVMLILRFVTEVNTGPVAIGLAIGSVILSAINLKVRKQTKN